MAELEFHGAAQTVTGSMHLLHLDGGTLTLDCGLFQGKRDWARGLNSTFPVPPETLRAVVLSHAHMDHSGNIPGLVRKKFTGPVYATPATRDLAEIMLLDSAHIQEEDALFWNQKRAGGPADRIEPLYTVADAQAAVGQFRSVAYGTPFDVCDGCRATFFDAGHMLGSAVVLLEIASSPPVRLLFTGDLGRFNVPILRDPTTPLPAADYLITESTYADQIHEDAGQMKERLVGLINATVKRGGKVIIPSFSVGRTQTLTYYLQQAIEAREMPRLPVFVDSPLSTHATDVFRKHPECYDVQAAGQWRAEGDVFGHGFVTYISEAAESIRLNDRHDPCVIIASSGMCEAGRILHHLKNNVEDSRNTVLIVGYQAENTLGRRIAEGETSLKIFGRMYQRRCHVEVLGGFSAHADAKDFERLLAPLAPRLRAAFVVHGEATGTAAMKALLQKAGCRGVYVPAPGEKFTL
jgi:metallo-beta-lactamase family protein